ncbi:response regulator [Rhizobacter sp. J219]|uniref:ATP-binding response regulator n=1 Tax=Rhizobacter sp. J219 TaxID=2898430 RepID=UPI00215074EC|nr:response regulator [Rhizobacter sp. J219]MCR5882434.1 response regulator [Rhizobacter sp. J219]
MQHRDLSPGPGLPDLTDRLPGIIATAMDAIVVVDATQRIVLFNDAACRMFGRTAAETLGQPLDLLIPGAARAAHRQYVANYGAGAQPARKMGTVRALHGLRGDGTEFPIEATIARLGSGPDLLMTAMVRDVTEVREAERARQLRIATEAADRAQAEFLSRMSHELRTPLNAVLGITHLLRTERGDGLTPAEARHFDLLHQSGLQLQGLIEQMLRVGQYSDEQPCNEQHGATSPRATTPDDAAAPSGTVLYIEDNAINALLVVEVLRPWPQVQVLVAETGAQGLALARERRPSLVLLDMRLPDMNGHEVLAALRADPSTRELKVAVLTANAVPMDADAALAAGALAYWTKPIDFPAFLANVRALLQASPGQNEPALSPPPA